MASPFVCRSGHIFAFAEGTLPGDGRVGEGVNLPSRKRRIYSSASCGGRSAMVEIFINAVSARIASTTALELSQRNHSCRADTAIESQAGKLVVSARENLPPSH